ncbi:nucleotide-diphospho-sugar transferase, partial [Aureobasidium melanogenum]
KNKWMSLGWQFNALKTMRYWHENIWRDEEVVCLHYIVDKPWAKRVSEDGVAGYLGRDGETHTWWWQEYEDWHQQRKSQNETEELEIAEKHVAKPIGQEDQETDEMRAIGSGVQSFANNKKPGQSKEEEKKQAADGDKEEDLPQPQIPAPHELKGKPLGERGHGPRVRG